MIDISSILSVIEDEEEREYAKNEYLRYLEKMKVIAFSILKNDPDADDCVGNVVGSWMNHISEYRTWDTNHQKNFLSRCCRNQAITMYNAKKERYKNEFSIYTDDNDGVLDIVDVTADVQQLFDIETDAAIVRSLIAELPPRERDLLILSLSSPLKYKELAEMFGIEKNHVGVIICRTKRNITKKYEEIQGGKSNGRYKSRV